MHLINCNRFPALNSENTLTGSYTSKLSDSLFVKNFDNANDEIFSKIKFKHKSSGWNENVKNIIVVLCASRSGSSLIFNALSSTGKVISPAGEHEPWLSLSSNKYPFIESDAVLDLNNRSRLLMLLRNDLLIREDIVSTEEFLELLSNRLVIRRQERNKTYLSTVEMLKNIPTIDTQLWSRVIENLESMKVKLPATNAEHFLDPRFALPLENPPFINQPLARIASDEEIEKLTLLFKSPSDAYRHGFYESLFPNARINYIHLSRGFVQTTNGLIDGWLDNRADFISNPVGVVEELGIEGYSNTNISKAYWCFDLFPGWENFRNASLVEVCATQWATAHENIIEKFPIGARLTFEQFYSNPKQFYKNLTDITGIDTAGYDWSKKIMSSDTPSQHRWLKREELFKNIERQLSRELFQRIIVLQTKLGYSMEPFTWY